MADRVNTRADSPAALNRARRDRPDIDPWVDLCAELRRLQLLAAATRAQLGRWPRGRRAARVEQLAGEIELAAQSAAILAAWAARARDA